MACKVVIVGAGIIGASAAYNLQRAGADVTVVDAGLARATDASFGWINASYFLNADHFRLRLESMAAYRRLAEKLPVPVRWSGCLCWEETGKAFDAQLMGLREMGYQVEELDAATFARLEPHVAQPPDRCLLLGEEAAAESGALALNLLCAAVEAGAQTLLGVRATGFSIHDDRITGIETNVGPIAADQVLVAAGIHTQALMAGLDVNLPMLDRPALVLKTRPVVPIVTHVLVSGIGEVRQCPDGSLIFPVSVGHQSDEAETIDTPPHEEADRALVRLQAMFPEVPLSWSQVTLAYRPMPADGLPAVGPVKSGLYVATMHSGITLGALMGELIAAELLEGATNQTATWLAPYRPERFICD